MLALTDALKTNDTSLLRRLIAFKTQHKDIRS